MNVYIAEAKRTAIGKFQGSLANESASDLCSKVCETIAQKIDSKDIDEVIVGNVLSAATGQGLARQISLKAGFGIEVPAYSIDMVCGSGMKAVMNGYSQILSNNANCIIAGGVESMSNAPLIIDSTVRNGTKLGALKTYDHILKDGLTDGLENYHMGITAENLAQKYEISRQQQDQFALDSQSKALCALASGRFNEEIIDYETKSGEVFNVDEFPRKTSIEKLGKLRPAFKENGTVTAGNSSGINDGASALLLVGTPVLEKYNLKPLVEIKAIAQVGVEPSEMGIAPYEAVKKLLLSANMDLKQIDILELNEAFASQSLSVIKELANEFGLAENILQERVNVNGGAISLGHPLGMSGNRIIVSLVHEMQKRNCQYGIASLCIGGGMGAAILLKREVNNESNIQ